MNIKELKYKAQELKLLLEKYQLSDPLAREVLKSAKDILTKAINEEIHSPVPGGRFHIYLEPGYELSKYNDLSQVAAEFSILLEGWSSLEEFRKDMAILEQKANIVEAAIRSQNNNKIS